MLNTQIYDRLPRADNPEFQKKVHDDCYVGLVSKFGANRTLPNRPTNGQLDPNTPLYMQLVNDDKQLIDEVVTTPLQPVTQAVVLG